MICIGVIQKEMPGLQIEKLLALQEQKMDLVDHHLGHLGAGAADVDTPPQGIVEEGADHTPDFEVPANAKDIGYP